MNKYTLKTLKNEYEEQNKIANKKNKELTKLKRELLKELEYQEVIDSKAYKENNKEYISEKRKAVTLYTKYVKLREELMNKYK